uniref:PP2C family protein-serine/threonine phosphatase n=1 Tax=uncultured Sphingomonas sp. TaxID=158754 RepID=UPI0035CB7F5B
MKPWRVFTPEPLVVASVARSHVGLVRPINEDRVFDCPGSGLWAVADGMGGHNGGDLAAQAVVDALRDRIVPGRATDAGDMLAAIRNANAAIVARNEAEATDAGSTVVAAHVAGRTATIAWVGDSRAYLLRGGAATQLSHDHSLVQELIDAGLLTIAAAARHPRANVVTRALGVTRSVEIATVTLALEPDDRLLLCSDGLSRPLQDMAWEPHGDLHDLTARLLADALRRDGSDNISLICIALTVA